MPNWHGRPENLCSIGGAMLPTVLSGKTAAASGTGQKAGGNAHTCIRTLRRTQTTRLGTWKVTPKGTVSAAQRTAPTLGRLDVVGLTAQRHTQERKNNPPSRAVMVVGLIGLPVFRQPISSSLSAGLHRQTKRGSVRGIHGLLKSTEYGYCVWDAKGRTRQDGIFSIEYLTRPLPRCTITHDYQWRRAPWPRNGRTAECKTQHASCRTQHACSFAVLPNELQHGVRWVTGVRLLFFLDFLIYF